MMRHADAWSLPGLVRWKEQIEAHLHSGLAVVPTEPSCDPNLFDTLVDGFGGSSVSISVSCGRAPATAIGDAFRQPPTLDALKDPTLDGHLGFIDLRGTDQATVNGWVIFLKRFCVQRSSWGLGPSFLVLWPSGSYVMPGVADVEPWHRQLRRGDLVIWAEEHLPRAREGVLEHLAVMLAVELCGWRLDLAAALVQAALSDLADPLDWLSRRTERVVRDTKPTCPLAARDAGLHDELRLRVWRAQLASLFPELETVRIDVVSRNRSRLVIDERLRALGVTSVDEIEFGGLRHQLRHHLKRPQADELELLARARNALAHRRPIDPDDLKGLVKAVARNR